MSFLVSGAYGNEVYNNILNSNVIKSDFRNGDNITIEMLNSPESFDNANVYSSRYIEDGSFIKLREIAISYLLKDPFSGVSDITFTLSGRNLMSIDNFSSWDPEVNMDAQSNGSRGGVMGLIPIPRTIKFALTANF